MWPFVLGLIGTRRLSHSTSDKHYRMALVPDIQGLFLRKIDKIS
jgi:hypothetical protein